MVRVILLTLLIIPNIVMACPDFHGKWQSSKELTMSFTQKWSKIEEPAKSLLEQLTGTETVEYTKSEMKVADIPLRKIIINGKEMEWRGTNETVKYELLACTENTVAIKYRIFERDFISLLYFEGSDTYWLYTGRPEFTGNAHTREFFVRVAPNKSLKDAP